MDQRLAKLENGLSNFHEELRDRFRSVDAQLAENKDLIIGRA